VGNILGKTGAQSKRQHELSISMKKRFNDELAYIVNCIVKNGTERSEESLEKSIAYYKRRLETRMRVLKTGGELVSFSYVAAAVCLRARSCVADHAITRQRFEAERLCSTSRLLR
jgi:hypothetical protein